MSLELVKGGGWRGDLSGCTLAPGHRRAGHHKRKGAGPTARSIVRGGQDQAEKGEAETVRGKKDTKGQQ